MAKKTTEKKIVLERMYIIPLRKRTLRTPYYKKSKKAISVIKEFIMRHMKPEQIVLGTTLNEKVWEHGIKNPPGKIKVTAVKDDKGVVYVELFGVKPKALVQEKKAEEKKDTKEVKEAEFTETKKTEESKETQKEIEHTEITELKHEHQKTHAPHESGAPAKQPHHEVAPKSM